MSVSSSSASNGITGKHPREMHPETKRESKVARIAEVGILYLSDGEKIKTEGGRVSLLQGNRIFCPFKKDLPQIENFPVLVFFENLTLHKIRVPLNPETQKYVSIPANSRSEYEIETTEEYEKLSQPTYCESAEFFPGEIPLNGDSVELDFSNYTKITLARDAQGRFFLRTLREKEDGGFIQPRKARFEVEESLSARREPQLRMVFVYRGDEEAQGHYVEGRKEEDVEVRGLKAIRVILRNEQKTVTIRHRSEGAAQQQ